MFKWTCRLVLLFALLSTFAYSGLPPTTSKGIGDSTDVTTFKFQFPGLSATHTGTTASLDLPNVGPGAGSYTFSNITIDTKGRITAASNGSAGALGAATGIESILQKLELEKSYHFSENIDNSIGYSGQLPQWIESVTGYLLSDVASGATTSLPVIWNPVYINSSDKDNNSATGWAAAGNATANAVSATKITDAANASAKSLSFNKTAGGTEAEYRYDRGAQTLALYASPMFCAQINIPDTTNLTDVFLKVYADSTSNYRKWTSSTKADGTSLAVGWNLVCFDISTGGSAGGSGYVYTQLSRYQGIGVDAGSAQTYSAILIDAAVFGLAVSTYGFPGAEVSIYDNTHLESVTIDSTATGTTGYFPLKAATSLTNAYIGGFTNAALTNVKRSLLKASYGSIGFDTTLAGAASLSQSTRLSRTFRSSQTLSPVTAIDVATPQVYRVNTVGGSTIGVDDVANTSANLKNGDVVDVFMPIYDNGETRYIARTTNAGLTMGADSTASGGTTTLTLTTTGIQVNDLVVKRHLSTAASFVATGANESYSALTPDATPDGIQMVDRGSTSYPNPSYIVAHWALGGLNSTEALRDKRGTMPSLIAVGSPNTTGDFLFGRQSATGMSASNYFWTNTTTNVFEATTNILQVSFWLYPVGVTGDLWVASNTSITTGGVKLEWTSGSKLCVFAITGSCTVTTTISPNTNQWNHIFVQTGGAASSTANIFINGVLAGTGTNAVAGISGNPAFWVGSSANTLTAGDKLADMVVWYGGSFLTTAQIGSIYRNGNYVPFDGPTAARYKYTQAGITGQRRSIKATLTRTTTGVSPAIIKAGSM